MIIHHMEQRSDAWRAMKAGKISGTGFGHALAGKDTARRRDYLELLKWERKHQKLAPSKLDGNPHVEWGRCHEDDALTMYNLATGLGRPKIGFVEMNEWIGVSPDAWQVEIKCPKTTTHAKYIKRMGIGSQYKPQVQGCIWVCEVDYWDEVSYDPRPIYDQDHFRLPIMINRVWRDDKYIDRLSKACDEFITELKEI
jgi:hypothetical protein